MMLYRPKYRWLSHQSTRELWANNSHFLTLLVTEITRSKSRTDEMLSTLGPKKVTKIGILNGEHCMGEAQREGRMWREVKRLEADRSRWKSFVEALCSYTGDNRK
jgi:hypothetical protein